MAVNQYTLYENDLPKDIEFSDCIAIDTETMGLDYRRDRLCLVQISNGDGHAHLVQIKENTSYPILSKVLEGNSRPKFFEGVATVVIKLFNIIDTTHVFFGQKDAQQLIIIKKV